MYICCQVFYKGKSKLFNHGDNAAHADNPPALRPLQSALVGVAGVGRVAPRSFVFRSFDGSRDKLRACLYGGD